MKKWMGLFVILTLLSLFLPGCASTSEGTRTRCPKCASFYDTKEGADTFQWMRGQ